MSASHNDAVSNRRNTSNSSSAKKYLSLQDFEGKALRKLPRMLKDWAWRGVERDASVLDNRRAYEEYGFVTRVLRDVSARTATASLLGKTYDQPFGIAPMGAVSLCAFDADAILARAAGRANIPMVLSAASLTPMERIRKEGPTSWYQAYIPGEQDRIDALMERVEKAGFDTVVVTVDVAAASNREHNIRNGFSIPIRYSNRLLWDGMTHPGWVFGTLVKTFVKLGMPHVENGDAFRGPPIFSMKAERNRGLRDRLTWEHLGLIRERWKGKLIVKGVLSADDALRARDHGVDGIVISNHGGRMLDGSIAPLRVLPGIVAAVPEIPVMIDGSIRRGTDVLKALALGASFVFLGRPFLYAAIAAGEPGVDRAIELLSEEIERNMALMGINELSDLSPESLVKIR